MIVYNKYTELKLSLNKTRKKENKFQAIGSTNEILFSFLFLIEFFYRIKHTFWPFHIKKYIQLI